MNASMIAGALRRQVRPLLGLTVAALAAVAIAVPAEVVEDDSRDTKIAMVRDFDRQQGMVD